MFIIITRIVIIRTRREVCALEDFFTVVGGKRNVFTIEELPIVDGALVGRVIKYQ